MFTQAHILTHKHERIIHFIVNRTPHSIMIQIVDIIHQRTTTTISICIICIMYNRAYVDMQDWHFPSAGLMLGRRLRCCPTLNQHRENVCISWV